MLLEQVRDRKPNKPDSEETADPEQNDDAPGVLILSSQALHTLNSIDGVDEGNDRRHDD
jgi:hypothetical protein